MSQLNQILLQKYFHPSNQKRKVLGSMYWE